MLLGADIGSSIVKDHLENIFIAKFTKSSQFQASSSIVMDGEKFYIEEGAYDTEYRKAYRKSFLPFLFYAVANASNDFSNKVVVGLPIGQYQEDKAYLSNLIMQNSSKEVIINDKPKTVRITDVEVAPEGIMGVDPTFAGVIIDIGGRTTDICLIQDNGSKRKILLPKSLPTGILNLNNAFIDKINSKLGLDLKEYDVDRILKNGLEIWGERQDINFAYEVYKEFVEELVSILQVDYSLKTNRVALLGGGGQMLYKPLEKRIRNVIPVPNAMFANAKGYYQYARGIWA